MHLREYLYKKKLKIVEFARQVDYSKDHISLVMKRKHKPSKKLGRIIEKATDGHVKYEDLIAEEKEYDL